MTCGRCHDYATNLFDGLCDRCVEQAHWDYQESMVE